MNPWQQPSFYEGSIFNNNSKQDKKVQENLQHEFSSKNQAVSNYSLSSPWDQPGQYNEPNRLNIIKPNMHAFDYSNTTAQSPSIATNEAFQIGTSLPNNQQNYINNFDYDSGRSKQPQNPTYYRINPQGYSNFQVSPNENQWNTFRQSQEDSSNNFIKQTSEKPEARREHTEKPEQLSTISSKLIKNPQKRRHSTSSAKIFPDNNSLNFASNEIKTTTKRSRMGCLTCRQRKKRCCETKPTCTECCRLGLICIWPKPGTEHKNKPKDFKAENTIEHEIYGKIKVLRGIVEYKSE